MLVQRGTLHVGDSIVCGEAYGRVRAMLDENYEPISEALPSRPVQVLGLTAVPGAGDNFLVVSDDRMARQIAERREARERVAQFAQGRRRVTLEDLDQAFKAGEREELLLIIKGDVSGSVEALEDALLKLDVGEEVSLRVIGRGVGAITQDDVNLAIASDAVIIGFNVRPAGRAGELAQREGVDIRYYSIIYQAIEEVEAALKGMLKPEFEEAQLGTAEIREIFRVPRVGNVAGSHRPQRHDPPRQQGAADPGRRGDLRQPDGGFAAPVQGGRDRGPRGLRVRYRHRLQRHQDRGHDRDVRDEGEAKDLTGYGPPACTSPP